MSKEHIKWLDSVKLIAALGIFAGHYWCTFYGLCAIKPDLNKVIVIISKPLVFLMNGSYCISIFCILSGYFARQKKLYNLKELLTVVLSRYLRFVFNLIIVNLLIYFIFCCNGFHTVEVGETLSNSWLASYYSFDMDITSVFKCAFLLSPELNGPLWTLKYIFIGTCVVYVYNYLSIKWKASYPSILFLIICVVLNFIVILYKGGGVQNSYMYVAVCFSGIALDKIWKNMRFCSKKEQAVFIILLVAILDLVNGRHNIWMGQLAKHFVIPSFMFLNLLWYLIYGFAFLVCINKVDWIKNILESDWVVKINNLTFAIYILHWLLICSFSLFTYVKLINIFSYTNTWVINLLFTVFVVFICAKVYNCIIEKNVINRILRRRAHR